MSTLAAAAVVTPAGVLRPGVVELDGGVIADVAPTTGRVPDRTLVPGFVDLQVNGHDDVDVSSAVGADWERLDALLVAQGVTTWCPTLTTAPLDGYAAPLDRIGHAAARPADGRPRIAGAHLEGPFLGDRPGAHRREWIVPPDLDWLARLPDIVRIVTLAPERPRGVEAVAALAARGVVVALGHSTADLEHAEAAAQAGARLVTHLFNAMPALGHRRPGLVGAALSDERLTVSLIADLAHVHPAVLKLTFRAKGPGGVALVTDAVGWRRGRVAGREIAVRDGAPRLPDGTLAGSCLTMGQAVRNCVDVGIDLHTAVAAASEVPARLLGLDDRGRLAPGAVADVVELGPALDVRAAWVAGRQAHG